MARKAKPNVKKLVKELESLYLRTDTEIAGRGLYHKVLPNIVKLGGHVDKDTELLVRIKELILEIKKLV